MPHLDLDGAAGLPQELGHLADVVAVLLRAAAAFRSSSGMADCLNGGFLSQCKADNNQAKTGANVGEKRSKQWGRAGRKAHIGAGAGLREEVGGDGEPQLAACALIRRPPRHLRRQPDQQDDQI